MSHTRFGRLSIMVNKSFNKYQSRGAYHWHWYENNTHNYYEYAQLTLSFFPESGSILDIGCGDGLISYLFYQQGFSVFGIDPDKRGISIAKNKVLYKLLRQNPALLLPEIIAPYFVKSHLRNKGIEFRQQSIENLEDEKNFDYSICLEVIEHLPNPDILIEKILSTTRKYAVLSTPNAQFCKPDIEDYQFWDVEGFIKLLGRNRSQLLYVDNNRIFAKLII